MRIVRRSIYSGNLNEAEINITQEQLDRWLNGELIQNVLPHLSPDEREFLISGTTSEEWEQMFGDEEK